VFGVLTTVLGLVGASAAAASPALAAAAPTITNITPSAGPTAGGNQAVITGTGFTDVSRVLVGTTPAKFTVASATDLTAVVPASTSTGRDSVRVVTDHGTSSIQPAAAYYTYVAAPRPLHVHAAQKIDDGNSLGALDAISCPSATFCAAFDANGLAMVYQNGTWSAPTKIDNRFQSITGVSCVSDTFCLATDTFGNSYRWNGTAWQDAASISGTFQPTDIWAISCASTTFCEAVDQRGRASTYTGSSWSAAALAVPDDSVPVLESVSCVSASFCFAAGDSDPYGRGTLQYGAVVALVNGVWTDLQYFNVRERLQAISCASTTFCAVGDSNGVRIWTGGPTWSGDIRLHGPAGAYALTSSLACPVSTFCVAYWQDSITGAKHWARVDGAAVADQSFPVRDAGSFPTAVSCWNRYACQFVGGTDTVRTS
jgi:hypothetical protein